MPDTRSYERSSDYCFRNQQLSRMMRSKAETETLGETLEDISGTDETEAVEDTREKVGGPTWIRTRDQPVMSRWL